MLVNHNHPLIGNLNFNPLIPIFFLLSLICSTALGRLKDFHMTFNVLLFKIANYQQINYIERALIYDNHEMNYYLCSSTQGLRKAICVENKN